MKRIFAAVAISALTFAFVAPAMAQTAAPAPVATKHHKSAHKHHKKAAGAMSAPMAAPAKP